MTIHDIAAATITAAAADGPMSMVKLNAIVFLAAAHARHATPDADLKNTGPMFTELQKHRPETTLVGAWPYGNRHALTAKEWNTVRDIVAATRSTPPLKMSKHFTHCPHYMAALRSTTPQLNPRNFTAS